MIVETRIHELLSRWEAADPDTKPTPEALCADHPELLEALCDRIARLRTIDRRLSEAARGADDEPVSPPVSPEIPGYDVHELIGHGGMGTVWRATQLGTQRQVALKVINASAFISPRARARFEREVELASRLNHPNIARVYDSGVHLGRLYYAMELIDGQPLDRFVESQQVKRPQFLELMQTICAAVHHAHQLGVIHRDLKPSNILVDPNGQPHVLDFGVAKAIDDADNRDVQITQDTDAPGTPAYMSPEQAAGRSREVGTASDVYTLGVILYQLVLNRLPHDVTGTVIEVMHRIATEEPARPRDVCADLDDDLEAIVIKALSREPEDRYASADEMGRDLGRFLAGLPVIAQRQTISYLMRKRLARHKGKLLVATALLAVAIGLAAWSYTSLQRQRARADTEARIAKAVHDFLITRLLTASDPAIAKGSTPTLRELLDRAAAEAGSAFRDQPLVEAQVRTTIGRAYANLSQRGVAPDQLKRAWQIYRDIYGDDDPRTLAAEADYAFAVEGDHRLDEAESLQRSLLDRSERALGDRHPITLMARHRIANIAAERGDYKNAEPLFRESLAARRSVLGADHHDTLWSLSDLGGVLSALGRAAEAMPLLKEAYAGRLRVQGPDSLDTINAQLNLACALAKVERYDEAERMLEDNLATRKRVYGPTHPANSLPIYSLAGIQFAHHQFEEAAVRAHEAFQLRFDAHRFEASGTMMALALEVEALVKSGQVSDARERLRLADDAFAESIRTGRPRSFTGIRGYIFALRAVGEDAKADQIEHSIAADAQ